MYANVIIEYGVKSLNKVFIYKIPDALVGKIKKGMKVHVPFGHQEIEGFVLSLTSEVEFDKEIKEIISITDENIYLDEELLSLGKYMSDYYLCSMITAYQTMLPVGLKVKCEKHNYELIDTYLVLKNKSKAEDYINRYPRRTSHKKIILELMENGCILKKGITGKVVDELVNNDIIYLEEKRRYRINKSDVNYNIKLTSLQNEVYENVIKNINTFNTYLLHGVTGSGKTEIYINWIKYVINLGKTAICLVPEISLTTQIAKRFYDAFGSDVAILHSALSKGEKYDEYIKIFKGEVHVVVGTRSAIFAPLKNLGIVIIDEEDSSSYKQDNNPRYHAIEMAEFRCKYHNIPLILASATPRIDSKARADKGVYKLLSLENRVGKSRLPEIHVVDMEAEMKKRNQIFGDLLKNKIKEKLDNEEQIILLLNRRGFSTFITCSNCGFTYKCPSCDITLTFHKSTNNLVCHYCGYQKKRDNVCPKCMEDALNYYGLGTERLESEIKSLYKTARVIRMDQDTTSRKGAHEKIITDFKDHKYDILLGTQMISKGLDFPLVTLVGVINADTTLNIPDYKSNENTFSLLSQVAGRSGRSDKLGEVVIQTFNPENYVIQCVKENDYGKFYLQEMNFRHKLKYPPYYYLVGIKVIGKNYEETINESKKTKRYLEDNLSRDFIILGPTTAGIFKFNNEYRMQIIIKYKKDNNLRDILRDLDDLFINKKDLRIEIDFSPTKI